MEFDEGGIFYSDQGRGDGDQQENESPTAARIKYREFVRTFRDGETFVYRDALRQAVSLNSPVLEIDLDHVMLWDDGAFVNGDSSSKHPAECCTHVFFSSTSMPGSLSLQRGVDSRCPLAFDRSSSHLPLFSPCSPRGRPPSAPCLPPASL